MLNLLRIAIILKANESVEHMKNCTTVDAAVDFHSCLLYPTSKFFGVFTKETWKQHSGPCVLKSVDESSP